MTNERCQPLKLFKVVDPAMEDGGDWDSWFSYVVAARNEDDARAARGSCGDNGTLPDTWHVTYLGQADELLAQGIICTDFRHG